MDPSFMPGLYLTFLRDKYRYDHLFIVLHRHIDFDTLLKKGQSVIRNCDEIHDMKFAFVL